MAFDWWRPLVGIARELRLLRELGEDAAKHFGIQRRLSAEEQKRVEADRGVTEVPKEDWELAIEERKRELTEARRDDAAAEET